MVFLAIVPLDGERETILGLIFRGKFQNNMEIGVENEMLNGGEIERSMSNCHLKEFYFLGKRVE